MKSEVFNIDCLEAMRNTPDKFYDLAVVDPPYGIGEKASRNNTGNRATDKWASPKLKAYKPFNDSIPYTKIQFDELCRVSKNQIVFGANNFDFLPASTGWIVWDKVVSENEHLSMCELAYTSFNIRCKKFTHLWAGFKKKQGDKLEEARTNHPTQKPVALYDWIYSKYLPAGGKVLDTHLGSGSNRIAAHKAGNIDFTGYEIDKDYFEAQEKRFKDYKSQLKMFV